MFKHQLFKQEKEVLPKTSFVYVSSVQNILQLSPGKTLGNCQHIQIILKVKHPRLLTAGIGGSELLRWLCNDADSLDSGE